MIDQKKTFGRNHPFHWIIIITILLDIQFKADILLTPFVCLLSVWEIFQILQITNTNQELSYPVFLEKFDGDMGGVRWDSWRWMGCPLSDQSNFKHHSLDLPGKVYIILCFVILTLNWAIKHHRAVWTFGLTGVPVNKQNNQYRDRGYNLFGKQVFQKGASIFWSSWPQKLPLSKPVISSRYCQHTARPAN